jgi:hypothetical protein
VDMRSHRSGLAERVIDPSPVDISCSLRTGQQQNDNEDWNWKSVPRLKTPY